jgi:hypothetical protein
MTPSRSFSYINVMAKLFEEEQENGVNSCLVAMLYDDAFRKSVALRACSKDSELDLDVAFAEVDKVILDSCRVKVRAITLPDLSRASHNDGAQLCSVEARLAKQTSAAEAAIEKAKNAARVFEQASWRMDEQWDDPEFDRSKAKRSTWLLGKLAESRQAKASRRSSSFTQEEGASDSSDARPPLRRQSYR